MRYIAVRRLVVDYVQDDGGNTVEVAVEPGQIVPEQYTKTASFDALLRQGIVKEDGYTEIDERLRVIEEQLGIESPAPYITEPVATDVMTHEVVDTSGESEAPVRRRRKKAGKHSAQSQEAAA